MSRMLAWIVAVATVVAAVGFVVLAFVGLSRGALEGSEAAVAPLFLVGVLAPTLVGLFLALRQPENRVAWILSLGALSVAVVLAASGVAGLALYEDRDSTLGLWAATVAAPWPVLFIWPLVLAFVFPDGALPSPRWRPVARAAFAICALIVVLLILFEEHESPYGPVPSPLPVQLGEWAVPIFWACWFGLLASLFAGAAAVRARYRAGDELLRRQVLWLAYGALLIPLWLGGTLAARPVRCRDELHRRRHADAAAGVAGGRGRRSPSPATGCTRSTGSLPRTLVYAALTVALVATYALVSLVAGLAIGDVGADRLAGDDRRRARLPAAARPAADGRRPPLREPALRGRAVAARVPRGGPPRARRAGGRRRGDRARARGPGRDRRVPAAGDRHVRRPPRARVRAARTTAASAR